MRAPLVDVRGTFYRAIDPRYREQAISGSRSAGRYSRVHEPTLYLSASIEGVDAAMIAHRDARATALDVVEVEVEAPHILDLRDADAAQSVGVDIADALAPWQQLADAGGTPTSWVVRDRLVAMGAMGLIDPSRKRPGLWHLVLFRWNEDDAPSVLVKALGEHGASPGTRWRFWLPGWR